MNKAVLLIPIAGRRGAGRVRELLQDRRRRWSHQPHRRAVDHRDSDRHRRDTPVVPDAGSSSPVAGPAACATANLTVSIGAGDGAAGSSYYPLHFANNGSATCTIAGFPGVSFVAPGNGQQRGAPATRSGDAGQTVTLAPGSEATAILQVADYENFDPSACAATQVSGFRVYPPGNTAAAYVALPAQSMACGNESSTQLTIQAVRAGATGM